MRVAFTGPALGRGVRTFVLIKRIAHPFYSVKHFTPLILPVLHPNSPFSRELNNSAVRLYSQKAN